MDPKNKLTEREKLIFALDKLEKLLKNFERKERLKEIKQKLVIQEKRGCPEIKKLIS